MILQIGIDPGVSGAIAVLEGGKCLTLLDMPKMKPGKRTIINARALCEMLKWLRLPETFRAVSIDVTATIEDVHSMPREGVVSAFSFGRSLGVVEGVLAGLGIPTHYVSPATWKRQYGLLKKDKEASRALAIRLHPEASHLLQRVKDHNRAESLLIAHFSGGAR